jgi:glycosyltransferase involved in cell wall biosynthesis
MNVQVTVICTCYNQQPFIKECLQSVVNQTYTNIQLIVIDNASTDGSSWVVKEFMRDYPDIIFMPNISNIGLCAAFNKGLEKATGKYIIDLAADDVMVVDRVQKQVQEFEKLPADYAVVFSNASYVDEKGKQIGFHYSLNKQRRAAVPTGNVYKEILRRYFICTPTIMMRKSVLFKLGGYDESLSYEDFDFFIRSAHSYKYHYLDEVLMRKRVVRASLGKQFYSVGNTMLDSSWKVCNKAYDLNHSQEEFDLLALRIREFIKKCFVAQDADSALKFRKLLNYIEEPGWKTDALVWLCRLRLPVNGLYQLYARWRASRNLLLMQQGMPFVQLNA